MRISNIKIYTKGDIIEKVQVSNNVRNVEIKVGKEMVVKPLNKLKKKHRDRRGVITKFVSDPRAGIKVQMKFSDTNRTGKVDIEDLDDLR
jgi:uncharacterized lipoprotein YehR (DUF1307 family)